MKVEGSGHVPNENRVAQSKKNVLGITKLVDPLTGPGKSFTAQVLPGNGELSKLFFEHIPG